MCACSPTLLSPSTSALSINFRDTTLWVLRHDSSIIASITTTMTTDSSQVPETFTLNTGAKIPAVGFGTWKAAPGDAGKAVEAAFQAGYRHFDCAPLCKCLPNRVGEFYGRVSS